jgi:hypothetical protein
MVNPNPSFLSKRVQRRDQSGITSDRYQFLGLDQAEPDLGDPLVGVSSIGVNPFTVDLGEPFVLVSDGKKEGNRYWTPRANIIAGGVVQPGAVSIFTNGELASGTSELSIFKLNFTGAGVTAVGVGSDRADIDITVTDVTLFTGQTGSIGYKDSSGLLQGADTLIFNPITGNVGVGSTQPTQRLDVLGSAKISNNLAVGGTITANQIIAENFSIDNFNIKDNTIVFDISEGGVGIGTTQPIALLDVRGDVNISGVVTVGNLRSNGVILGQTLGITSSASVGSLSIGSTQVISSTRQLQNIVSLDEITTTTIETAIANAPNTFTDLNIVGFATIANLGVLGLTTTRDFITSGIATIPRLNVTQALNSTGISTITNLRSTNVNVTGISTFSSLGVSGLTTSRNLTVHETLDANLLTAQNIGVASSVGIGTTVARYNLDVKGNINLDGGLYLNNDPGTDGKVLLSKGISASPIWGDAEGVNVGSATSVTTVNKDGVDLDYYVTFVNPTSGSANQSIFLDNGGIRYNPATNTLSVDTIKALNLEIEGLNRYTSGIVTTSSKNELIIDTLDTSLFRSARYSIQINTLGQLTLNNSASVSSLNSGTNYYPGIYDNISLTNITGSGIDARARIEVSPEATLPIVGSFNGTFTTTGSLVGVNTSQSIIFDRTILPSEYENSKVSNVTITNSGNGYTSIPTFTFSSPIIEGNPVEGVGVGTTATGVVNSMKVSNVIFNSVGFLTSTVPTIQISTPFIGGSTATARVGFAISTITVTNSGIGYLSIPSVQFSPASAIAGVSTIFVNRLRVTNPGFGYTFGDLGTTVVFSSGSAAANNTSFSLPGSHLGYTITNPGLGYTAPPILTVGSPQIGINTGTASATLGVVTAIVTQSGTGYTVSPAFTFDPPVTGFSGYVGMGISDFALQLFGGGGYDSNPTVSFNPIGGIGTGAAAFAQIDIQGTVESITITNPGFGYTVPPLVIFDGGTPLVSAAATIRTLVATNFVTNTIGFGASEVVNINVTPKSTEFVDLSVSSTGTVGVATTSRVTSIIFSSQGTLSVASTTIISGISTFNTIIREKTGNLDSINDTTISGVDISNVSVGFAVTGTFVQAGTAVSFVNSNDGGTIGLTTNLTNPTVGFGLTFFISDTLFSRVIVGQGIAGNNIDQREFGTTVVSIGNSQVTMSRPALNTGSQTSTFSFGTLEVTPAIFQTNLITGINTTKISPGQLVTSTVTQSNTNVISVGINSVTLDKTTTNVGIATTTFNFFDVILANGTGASAEAFMGIGRVSTFVVGVGSTAVGFGTGYLNLPGIAVTAVDGITGGGGIVTTSSFGIDTNCISITNPGIYTSIPNVLINSPIGSGSAAVASVGIGISTILVSAPGSYVGTKPEITLSGGSPIVSAAATVTNIVLNTVIVDTSGSNYRAENLPVTATFSNVSLASTVGLAVDTLSFTSGLGYTTTPTITFSVPEIPGLSATANAILSNLGPEFSILPGPGYGSTFVYYIEPLSVNTFRIFRDINRINQVTVGYSTLGTPLGYVGGEVTDVSIIYGGSGYDNGDIISTNPVNLDNQFSSNIGSGFNFTANNVIQNYQISDLMMLQSVGSASTSADIIEYGGINNLDDLVTFSADISSTNARLKVIPRYRDNVIKISRTTITI